MRLEPVEGGFARIAWRERREVRWAEIDRVLAYKQDLYAVDLLCLAVEVDADLVHLDEEMPGFESVLRALEAALGIAPEWRLQALFPAFEANFTLLYTRSDGVSGAAP